MYSSFTTFAPLVPGRTDDYTWANKRLAFHTYGHEAARLVVAEQPGGTFTSGMGSWHKPGPYSIIDATKVKEVSYYHLNYCEAPAPTPPATAGAPSAVASGSRTSSSCRAISRTTERWLMAPHASFGWTKSGQSAAE